jgi:hypothetical protein
MRPDATAYVKEVSCSPSVTELGHDRRSPAAAVLASRLPRLSRSRSLQERPARSGVPNPLLGHL